MIEHFLFWSAIFILLGYAQYIRNRYLTPKK